MIGSIGFRRARRLAAVAGVLTGLLIPAAAAAHPLGNFTINHYAGIRVSRDEIRLDIVIDQAEIPTFDERLRLDTDGDGELSDAEVAAARDGECRALASSLELRVAGATVALMPTDADLSFPLGAGLPTMRLECGYAAPLPGPLPTGGVEIGFADRSFEGRLGWREIVVEGDGATVEATAGAFLPRSISERLTRYPTDALTTPLAMSTVTFRATPGGAAEPTATPGAPPPSAEGPPAIFGAADLSPVVLLMSLLTAIGLGAAHALTPGHGKTLVAASLVGARGRTVDAVGLGLAVTVSHTLGILVLAAIIVGAQGLLPADVVARWLPFVAALGILAVGTWMLAAEIRRLRPAHSHRTGVHPVPGATGAAVAPRSLFALGLAGGIVPSTSALLILLGAIAAGRPAFGVVLVLAFGLGMAAILVGVGVAIVRARGWVDRASVGSRLHAVSGYAPLVASIVVVSIGAWLTVQSLVALAPGT